MPLYRFHIDATVPPQAITERLRCAVSDRLKFREYFEWRKPGGPPFIGSIRDFSFRIRRDIRYRNSFLPLIWGHIVPTPMGARVVVTMFMHPLVLAFMLFWLGMAGRDALKSASSAGLWGILMFVIALSAAGFIPEVVKAKRLLSAVVLSSGSSAAS